MKPYWQGTKRTCMHRTCTHKKKWCTIHSQPSLFPALFINKFLQCLDADECDLYVSVCNDQQLLALVTPGRKVKSFISMTTTTIYQHSIPPHLDPALIIIHLICLPDWHNMIGSLQSNTPGEKQGKIYLIWTPWNACKIFPHQGLKERVPKELKAERRCVPTPVNYQPCLLCVCSLHSLGHWHK